MDPRAKLIAQQEAIIAILTREGEKDDKDTAAAVKAADAAHKAAKEATGFKDLTVSWTTEGGKKEKLVVAAGELSTNAFLKATKLMPAAVAAKAFPKPAGASSATLLNDYRRRNQARHTKLRNAMARISQLRAGG